MPSARAWGWTAVLTLLVTLGATVVTALVGQTYAAGVIAIVGIMVAVVLARGYGYAKDKS